MQQRQNFSVQTLALSVAAAELGRAILGAGKSGAVRSVVLGGFLSAAVFVLLSALVWVNSARLNRPCFASRCICAAFLLWYLVELARTAGMLQQVCWEQFSSMAYIGLLPLFLWAGWSFGCELFDRMSPVLWWLLMLGAAFCVLGLAGQLRWQNLAASREELSFVFPDALLYPEYFSFPLLCGGKNSTKKRNKSALGLPIIAAVISVGYALGLALLFGVSQGEAGWNYPACELLRAWSFGGISRFDAAFLLIWLATALFRFCFLVRVLRLLCERLSDRRGLPGAAGDTEAAR